MVQQHTHTFLFSISPKFYTNFDTSFSTNCSIHQVLVLVLVFTVSVSCDLRWSGIVVVVSNIRRCRERSMQQLYAVMMVMLVRRGVLQRCHRAQCGRYAVCRWIEFFWWIDTYFRWCTVHRRICGWWIIDGGMQVTAVQAMRLCRQLWLWSNDNRLYGELLWHFF